MSRGPGPSRPSTSVSPSGEPLVETAEDPLLAGLERPLQVLVVGASGFLGRHLVERLASRGHRVRAVARGGAPDDAARLEEVTWLAADAAETSQVAGLAGGCDAVVQLAGIRREDGRQTFRRVHVDGTANLLEESGREEVARFIFVSALGAAAGADGFFRSKLEAEGRVRESRLDSVVFRPSIVYGPGDHFTSTLAPWLEAWPVCPVPRARGTAFQPVAVEDVTDALCQAVERGDVTGRIYALVGPEELTVAQLMETVAAVMGLRRPMVPLPRPLSSPLWWVAGRRPSLMGLPLDGWRELHRRMPVPPARGVNAFRSVFQIEPMRFREALEDYL